MLGTLREKVAAGPDLQTWLPEPRDGAAYFAPCSVAGRADTSWPPFGLVSHSWRPSFGWR